MKHDGLGFLLKGMLNPRTKAPELHLLACKPIIFGMIMLRGGFGHPDLEFTVGGVVLLFNHVGWNVERDAVGERMA